MNRSCRRRASKLLRRLVLAGALVALLSSPLSDEQRTERPRLFSAEPASHRVASGSRFAELGAGQLLDEPPSAELFSRGARAVALQGMFWSRDLAGGRAASWIARAGDSGVARLGLSHGAASGGMPGDAAWNGGGAPFGGKGYGEEHAGGDGGGAGGSGSGGIGGVGGGIGGVGGGTGGSGGHDGSPGSAGPPDGTGLPGVGSPPPIAPVPEPNTMALLGSGLAGLSALAWRRRRR